MKLKIKQEELNKLLKTVYPAVDQKPSIQSFGYIRIDAFDGGIKIAASNGTTTIQTGADIEIEDFGSVCLSGKILTDLVALLPPCELKMEVVNESKLRIKAARKTLHLNIVHSDAFTMIPNYSQFPFAESKDFFKTIGMVSHAISNDETRPSLLGVSLRDNTVAATDGHRLAMIPYESGMMEIVIPKDGIDKLRKIFTDKDLRMYVLESSLHFLQGKTAATIRLISSEYPKLSAVVPGGPYDEAIVSKSELVTAMKMAKAAQIKMGRVSFHFKDNNLHFEGSSETVGVVEEDLQCEFTGDFKFMLNFKYLLEAMEKLEENVVKFELRDPIKPIAIKEGDFLQIVMPMR